MTAAPFKAVLARCNKGHYEANTLHAYTSGPGIRCARCTGLLRIVKVVTISPGATREQVV